MRAAFPDSAIDEIETKVENSALARLPRAWVTMVSIENVIEANIKPILYALFNIISVTCIVVVNKKVFNEHHFHFPILLVLIHTCITYLGLRLVALLGFFDMKDLPLWPRLVLAGSFVLYNSASLINLNVNTVGFYQISKILVTPTVMLINFLMYSESTTSEVKAAVTIMLVGVTMATVTDVDVTTVGLMIGLLAVFGSAQQQILIQRVQKKLGATSNQVLVSYTPYVAVMLAIVSPLDHIVQKDAAAAMGVESYRLWLQNYGSVQALGTIFFSGCCGLLVSLSTFLMINATSALTYNIVGHLKTVTILAMGVMMFGDSMSVKKFAGIVLALVGVVWYSKINLDKQRAAKAPVEAAKKKPASSAVA